MALSVKLQVFEGPLDLLLHLIDINKIDIYDIPISLITDQYLAYYPADAGAGYGNYERISCDGCDFTADKV